MYYYKTQNGCFIKTPLVYDYEEITEAEYVAHCGETPETTEEEALARYANELTGADDPDLISAAETLITERIKEES